MLSQFSQSLVRLTIPSAMLYFHVNQQGYL